MKVRVASAGTGKTTGLVAWFLARVDEGVPLRRMAGVTFTRAAADELRTRVADALRIVRADGAYLGDLFVAQPGFEARFDRALQEADGATLDTIHGFMASALRLSAPWLGLDPEFVIVPPWEADAAFEEELRGWIDDVRHDPAHPGSSALAVLGDDAEAWAATAFRHRSLAERWRPAVDDERAAALVEAYGAVYARFLARTGGSRLAPAEIEKRAVAALRTPLAVQRLVQRFPWIVVDEFQDVNPVQGRFFTALEEAGAQIEVVGDPKQSIYGFRHADVGVFRDALRSGEALPPLVATRRHARRLVRFLNHMTRTVATRGGGFTEVEAPDVRAAGPQAEVEGAVEVHWVVRSPDLATARATEVEILVGRMHAARASGVEWNAMAVLAHAGERLRAAAAACRDQGIPTVLRRGGGYYERSEIRDLVHTLRVGIAPTRSSLAAWLRGPFGGLEPAAIAQVLAADDPRSTLADVHPHLHERLSNVEDAVRQGPRLALRRLLDEPWADGRRFVDRLDPVARDNVDAFAFEVAAFPPGDVHVWLARLDLLARKARDESGVPPDARGVTLTTVHGSKGLEWPWVAWIDAGAGARPHRDPVTFDAEVVHVRGGPAAREAASRATRAARLEMERLAYVAASRPRDTLVVIGSAREESTVWTNLFDAMAIGPRTGREVQTAAFTLARHAVQGARRPVDSATPAADAEVVDRGATSHPAEPLAAAPLTAAAWTSASAAPRRWSLVESPSSVEAVDARSGDPSVRGDVDVGEDVGADVAAADGAGEQHEREGDGRGGHGRLQDDGRRVPGHGTVVGTLLHDAIRQDVDANDATAMAALEAQELMFPYADDERATLMDDVRGLLASYHALLGSELPALHEREVDLREWPILLPDGDVTWRGVVDRLYRVGDRWYLDDYKADRTLRPERYTVQLACYAEAVRQVLGVQPIVRLVGLRHGVVVHLDDARLAAAWRARPATRARDTLTSS